MSFERASGLLVHPTSFPSRGGIGDFGPAAYEFVDFLQRGRQSLWQVLPLNPVGYGYSPYSATSAFAGNPLLISMERLAERGWLQPEALGHAPDGGECADFEAVLRFKSPLLEQAARTFLDQAGDGERQRLQQFCRENSGWLEDFALFDVLRRRHSSQSWNRWPRELARREPAALEQARAALSAELETVRVVQFFFFEQWGALRAYAAARGIKVIGDVAIFVSYDSADVWTHPDIFFLDENLQPTVVAGVPPDAFSETGQRWGNPLYNWEELQRRNYDWWVQRLRWATTTCDIVRLDHFRGFEAYWEIPAAEETAVNGRWVKGPGADLFRALQAELGDLPYVAEDLGLITEEVEELRQAIGVPGMKVLQFGFGDYGSHIYLPHRYESNCVVYTGTHDNDTTLGWWQSTASEEERRHARAYLGEPADGIHWAMIRAAMASPASLCVIPLQDVLGLGSEARMNTPSQADGNWSWRYREGALTAELAARLAELAEVCDRDRPSLVAQQQGEGEVGQEFAA